MAGPLILTILVIAGALTAPATASGPLDNQPMAALENRRAAIDSELVQLATFTLSSGVGSVGYQSQWLAPDQQISLRIDLKEEHPIDQIILVPSLWRDTKTGVRSDGFPPEFRVLAGTATTTNLLASFTREDRLLPRIAPLAIDFRTVRASWVRVQVRNPPKIESGTKRAVKLSEIMVFSGAENVALRKPVEADSSKNTLALHETCLVDGFVPYLLDSAHGEKSQSVQLWLDPSSRQHALSIDLGASLPVNQLNLHAIDQNRSIPASHLNDYAIPRHLQVTGANDVDFSDETVLFESRQHPIRNIGPIMMQRFPETLCRYIRITAIVPTSLLDPLSKNPMIAFSEIEVLSKGRNIAAGRPLSVGPGCRSRKHRSLALMTDGRNYFGDILPLRQWMNELAERHDLETERPAVVAELNRRYARQKRTVKGLIWMAALLAGGIAATILIERRIQRQKLHRIRERIAADLHDELGANLHTIGLLSQLIENKAAPIPEEAGRLFQRIRDITGRSSIAVRHIARMQEAGSLYTGLHADMERAAERIVAELKHDIEFDGEEYLARLRPQARVDLFLFYKECLVNICRHSGATELSTRLSATPQEVRLCVTDNGSGLVGAAESGIPAALSRRAKLMRARVSAESPASGGTRICLRLRTRRSQRLPKSCTPS